MVSDVFLYVVKSLFVWNFWLECAIGRKYTDEEILQSLEQVGFECKDFPNNILDYYVGDDGRLLSGGAEQSTLARAVK